MSMVCTGCGAPLQMEREGEKGYITGDAFMREHPLCQRCYRLKHYGQISSVGISEEEYRTAVMRVLDKPALVLYVVDLFDFNGSLVRGLTGVLNQHEVIMAANKFDLFPWGVKADGVRNWLLREARRAELDVTQTVVLSAKSGQGVAELGSILEDRAKGRPIVVIGMANVGKSSLLNRIIEQHDEHVGQQFTTSHFPGTTLGAVAMKLMGGMTIVDTPGLLGIHRLQDRVCTASLKDIIPGQRLRPRVYQLRPGQTLFLGGLARVDFVRGPAQPFVVYVANQLLVHRTKLVQADDLWTRQRGKLLAPPCSMCDEDLSNIRSKKMGFKKGRPVDVVMPGLGWVRLSGEDIDLNVHLPDRVEPAVRPALIGS